MEATTFGQLPAIRITAPGGAAAIVTLYGAHLVSWQDAQGQERLFCSARSALDGSRAIRGGVPVIFPQFAERGTGMRHGFARVATWRLTDSGIEGDAAWAVFGLNETDLPPGLAQGWPHRFALALRVTLRGDALEMAFDVHNTGAAPFPFAAALHTYHLVPESRAARIDGVEAGTLQIADKLDKVYQQVAGSITLGTGERTVTLEQEGFADAVVWNPGAADAAALADMDDEEYRRFVCIEPALLAPHTLAPGAIWHGRYRIA